MYIKTFSTHREFVEKSAEAVAECCRMSGKRRARIIVSGGSTPMPIYAAFSKKKDVPFENIEFFQADERYVPPTHPASNYGAIKNALGAKVISRLAAFHRFNTLKQIPEALADYEKEIKSVPFFDLAVLGIGADGHIASLFPHSKALKENKRLTAHTTTDQFAVKDRFTLTFPALFKNKKLLILLEGPSKKHIVDELQSPTQLFQEFPACKLLEHKDCTIHYLHL